MLLACFVSAAIAAETGTPARAVTAAAPVADRVTQASALGATVERHGAPDEPRTAWTLDEQAGEQGDRIEKRQVLAPEVKTVKLQSLVPPIRFASGEAEIPDGYTALLRGVLDRMKDRLNVRLHFVGHTDNMQLVGAAKVRYGDNLELSRERAATVAEYFQRALNVPPESISFEGAGEDKPIATNATEEGRARNRRVEVEVWYDEVGEKLVEQEVVVGDEINRVKVCRVETVCKLRYREGHARRARIKNLIPPLHFEDEATGIPDEFLRNLQQALVNLQGKQNVTVRFIGYTDSLPLTGRAERIYGTHEALSKARARRASLAVQDALKLPTSALEVDGRGAAQPLASNDTAKGRALNRRIEVEFWYDDALQELPDEPQICPEAAGAETVTRVYDPPAGGIKPILYEHGKPVIPPGYAEYLKEVMDGIQDKTRVRLRFIGYTNNERLERRTAMVYGDDIGLSTARARRAMAAVKEQLGLTDRQVEFEGRGDVQSNDVVNTGFIESDTARVEVQVVYDELASLDDDSLEVTRLTREVEPKDPFALNLMRITVDGKPVDDPGKGMSDIQRCTDVALDKAQIRFRFDNLEIKPRLNASAWPTTVRYQDDPETELPENLVQFRAHSNYPGLIEKAEVRIFESLRSERDAPLAVVEVNEDGYAEWQATFDEHEAPGRELKYVLRVYDRDGRFDETGPQPLWVVDALVTDVRDHDPAQELLVGYGETRLAVENIEKTGGTVRVQGTGIPGEHSVWLAGRAVPVDPEGRFVAETMLPPGLHTVEVAVLDKSGNGELFLRDLELKRNDWFYVAIADITAAKDRTNGPARLVTGDETHYESDFNIDGRLAYYTSGKFGDGWRLVSSADTLEGPVEDLFSNFLDKSPGALFRRIDPDYHYPTFADDGSVEDDAPTLGKFYVRLMKDANYGLWGNFKIAYTDNNLAHVDRGLYGANAHYQTGATTSFGEQRFMVDGFAAEPGTVAGRDEFLGTGGSLYFLRHQDILTGSERVRIEVRDKDSDLVIGVKNLTPVLDYDIDYLQGRILLSEPLSATASDDLLVASDSITGNPVYLVVRYEFTPGVDDLDTMAVGGRSHFWVTDHVKLGITSNRNEEDGNRSSLNAADLTLRKSAQSWIKLETSTSEGAGAASLQSNDGGFSFGTVDPFADENTRAGAYRVDASLGFGDIFEGAGGRLALYKQNLEEGYSAPGLLAPTQTDHYGGLLQTPLTDKLSLQAKTDKRVRDQGLETSASELDLSYQLTDRWSLGSGFRRDERIDRTPDAEKPVTQVEGERTDVAARVTYDSRARWLAYGYLQDTVDRTGNREENGRLGAGGSLRVGDRWKLTGEVSDGDLGAAGKLGTEFLYSDRTSLYLNYALENESADNGVRARKGNAVSGFRTRYSDSVSVYLEERYAHGDVPTGLTHSTGVDLAPTDRLNLGARLDLGTLTDRETGAETTRSALGLSVGYGFESVKLATAFEYRVDEIENPIDASVAETTTWLIKNSLKYQIVPDWRLVAKLNHAVSDSSLGESFGGDYTEAVVGYGYRPVDNDRLNALFKYTYFYNMPTAGQVTQVDGTTTAASSVPADYVQKSHIFSLDTMYDLTRRWTIGGKYAYRLGQVSLDRESPEFFDSTAHLYVLRADWRFLRRWDALVEARMLDLPDAGDRRSGALLAVYWHMGNNVKLGVGYNFTDFSDDLTDLDYDSKGLFLNVIGKM
ncbi:flagellar motor protein MotB [Sulfurifustis variabilis]|uniref:Flagellar motor protein MotB n=2 Tax=Sulfurifustis variabilis TaxID=1675686 RepID=A0A1B4V4R6_9GAMM|nr:flagellar motor protein MotB [Sulfurifustis variabilis]